MEFWTSIKTEPSTLNTKKKSTDANYICNILSICEAGFSVASVIKTIYRSKIHVEHETRAAI